MVRVFLLVLLSIAGFWYLADGLKTFGPGYVWIAYQDYSVETTFWFFMLLCVGLFLSLLLAYKLVQLSIYCLKQLGLVSKNFGLSKQQQQLHQARVAFLEAKYELALQHFDKALAKKSEQASFNDVVMAARAALALKQCDKAQAFSEQALKTTDASEYSVLLLNFDIAVAQKNTGLSKSLLAQLDREYPKDTYVKEKALAYFYQLSDWRSVERVYKQLSRKAQKQHLHYQSWAKAQSLHAEQVQPDLKSLNADIKHYAKLDEQVQISLLDVAAKVAVDEKQGSIHTALLGLIAKQLKSHHYAVLTLGNTLPISQDEALAVVSAFDEKKIEAFNLSASELSGLAEFCHQAKLENRSIDLYIKSLEQTFDSSVFARFFNSLQNSRLPESKQLALLGSIKA